MNDRLRELFDYQRFAGNKRLAALIERAEDVRAESLSDDDLEYVNAAGDIAAARIAQEEKARNEDK